MTRLLYLPDDATIIQFEVDQSPSQLCAAINAGLRPISQLREAPPGKLVAREIGATVIVAPTGRNEPTIKNKKGNQGLSRRQTQVHDLALRGLSSGEIAVLLHLSRRTVNYHLNQVKNRLRGSELKEPALKPFTYQFKSDD